MSTYASAPKSLRKAAKAGYRAWTEGYPPMRFRYQSVENQDYFLRMAVAVIEAYADAEGVPEHHRKDKVYVIPRKALDDLLAEYEASMKVGSKGWAWGRGWDSAVANMTKSLRHLLL